MLVTALALFITALLPATFAAHVRGQIEIPADTKLFGLNSDTRVLLDGGLAGSTWVRLDGTFVIHDVEPGTYIISVASRQFSFPELEVHVPLDPPASPLPPIHVRPHTPGVHPLPPTQPSPPLLTYPISLKPLSKLQYYETPAAFSLKALVMGNPMILMMGGMAVMAWLMPKLMANMDPEVMKEFQENQGQMARQMQSVQNMDIGAGLGKFLAGSTDNAGGDEGGSPQGASSGRQAQGQARRRK